MQVDFWYMNDHQFFIGVESFQASLSSPEFGVDARNRPGLAVDHPGKAPIRWNHRRGRHPWVDCCQTFDSLSFSALSMEYS
jgi:hypothetical protein